MHMPVLITWAISLHTMTSYTCNLHDSQGVHKCLHALQGRWFELVAGHAGFDKKDGILQEDSYEPSSIDKKHGDWCRVLGYFITSTSFNGGSIDVNKKLKSTVTWEQSPPVSGRDLNQSQLSLLLITTNQIWF